MQPQPIELNTQHSDAIHDTQLDYYSRFLATASSDCSVKVFSIADGLPTPLAHLTEHTGPVWTVRWAHPKFGIVLASSSYDGTAIVWQHSNSMWELQHRITAHTASVNSCDWAPHEFGRMLATAGSDGHVYVTEADPTSKQWLQPVSVMGEGGTQAHPMGALGLSWAPPSLCPQPDSDARVPMPAWLASAGCDGAVKVWQRVAPNTWTCIKTCKDHTDWVRDVQFSPDNAGKYITLASCGQDKRVILRRARRCADGSVTWESSVPVVFDEPVWRVSWVPDGTSLVVTTGDQQAFCLKQGSTFANEWLKTPFEAASHADAASAEAVGAPPTSTPPMTALNK